MHPFMYIMDWYSLHLLEFRGIIELKLFAYQGLCLDRAISHTDPEIETRYATAANGGNDDVFSNLIFNRKVNNWDRR